METLPYNLLIMADMDGWLIIAVRHSQPLFFVCLHQGDCKTTHGSRLSWKLEWPRDTVLINKMYTKVYQIMDRESALWSMGMTFSELTFPSTFFLPWVWDWGCHLMTWVKCSRWLPSQGFIMVNPPNWNK